MNRLDQILDLLNRHHQRATYGAVAGLVGRIPRSVLQGRPRDWRHSWVVLAATGRPSKYQGSEIHPDLAKRERILRTPGELETWLANPS